jgi:hypothetical protein
MDHPQTPRILAPHLQQFQHKLVRMLGKVVQLRGDTAVIDAGGNVDVLLNRVRRLVLYHLILHPIFPNLLPHHVYRCLYIHRSLYPRLQHLELQREGHRPRLLRDLALQKQPPLTSTQDSHLAVGHAVEIIGKVDGNLNIKVQAATDFGTGIGMLFLLLPHSSPFRHWPISLFCFVILCGF